MATWIANGATDTPAFRDGIQVLEDFYDVEKGSANTTIFLIAWRITSGLEKLSLQCELLFSVEAATNFEFYDISNLPELLSAVGGKAVKEGKAKAREAHE